MLISPSGEAATDQTNDQQNPESNRQTQHRQAAIPDLCLGSEPTTPRVQLTAGDVFNVGRTT